MRVTDAIADLLECSAQHVVARVPDNQRAKGVQSIRQVFRYLVKWLCLTSSSDTS